MSRLADQFDYMDLDDFEELLADKPRDERWELIDRRVVKLMVGARWEHHLLIQNINFAMQSQLRARNSPCRVFTETFYMKSKAIKSATLPDVMVRCGPIPVDATSFDDPTILVEVVSPGSAERDRSEKWNVYRRLTSLKHYVLVERDQVLVDVYDRVGDLWSRHRVMEGLDATLALPAIEVSIPLAEIYRDVIIPAA